MRNVQKKYYFLINSLEGGGAERVVSNLAAEFSKEAEITVFTLKDAGFYELPPNVKYVPLSATKSNLGMLLRMPWYVWKFRRVLADGGFDNGVSFLEWANFVHILAKKNAIISLRISLEFFKGMTGAVYRFLIRLLYPMAGKIVVNSEENRHDLAAYLGLSIDRIVTIYNPINLETVRLKSKEGIEPEVVSKVRGKKVFVTVGRIVSIKRHFLIAEALWELKKRGTKDFVWLVVGDGPERQPLETLVSNLGITENVVFLGSKKNPFPYVAMADVFIYASEVEGFPNVLLESIALGTPIVTSDFKTGAREVMLGEYSESKQEYPISSERGYLLSLADFETDFLAIYPKIATLRQRKTEVSEKFLPMSVSNEWKRLFDGWIKATRKNPFQ